MNKQYRLLKEVKMMMIFILFPNTKSKVEKETSNMGGFIQNKQVIQKTSEREGSLISPFLERGMVMSPITGRSMTRPKSSW